MEKITDEELNNIVFDGLASTARIQIEENLKCDNITNSSIVQRFKNNLVIFSGAKVNEDNIKIMASHNCDILGATFFVNFNLGLDEFIRILRNEVSSDYLIFTHEEFNKQVDKMIKYRDEHNIWNILKKLFGRK